MVKQLLVLAAALFSVGFGLECQLPSSSTVFDGSTVYIPGPTGDLQPIPPNFNCNYRIQAPANSTNGFYINLELKNGMKGLNDYILVTDVYGFQTKYTNRTRVDGGSYFIIPGAEMTVQVVTRSVNMGSMFSMILQYHANDIGPNRQMKTGGEMNFIDLSTLRDGKNYLNTITFVNHEPIYFTIAETSPGWYCSYCFVMDGTVQDHKNVYFMRNYLESSLITQSNTITLVTSSDDFTGIVLNSLSESKQFDLPMESVAVPNLYTLHAPAPYNMTAIEVVNFASKEISMDVFEFTKGQTGCKAYVMSGPPNNSSKVLLDLSTAQTPHTFDLQYFSVVAEKCGFTCSVSVAVK